MASKCSKVRIFDHQIHLFNRLKALAGDMASCEARSNKVSISDVQPMALRKAGQRLSTQPRYMLIESIKNSMMENAQTATSPEARTKINAVARWLLNVACCTGFEALHDDIAGLAEVMKKHSPRCYVVSLSLIGRFSNRLWTSKTTLFVQISKTRSLSALKPSRRSMCRTLLRL